MRGGGGHKLPLPPLPHLDPPPPQPILPDPRFGTIRGGLGGGGKEDPPPYLYPSLSDTVVSSVVCSTAE